jgi:hypothetical protein
VTRTFLFRRLLLALQRARRETLSAEGRPAPVPKEATRLSRRRFVKTAAFASAAGVVSGGMSHSVRDLTRTAQGGDPRVAIVVSSDRFLRTRWHQSRFTQGGYANFKPGQLTRFAGSLWIESERADERQEVHAGNLVLAGEHLSDGFYGFMNGAAETGRLAAEFVLRRTAELAVAARRASVGEVA